MDNTPNLHLPYVLAAQAQKHVTHNEALRVLDAIDQLSVLGRSFRSQLAKIEGGTGGEIGWDANCLYVCVATDTWKRSALAGG